MFADIWLINQYLNPTEDCEIHDVEEPKHNG